MGKLDLTRVDDTAPYRKMAMGSWNTVKDPSVYGLVEIDMQPVLPLLEAYSEKHQVKITPAHLVGRAIAYCMKRRPEINGMIRGRRLFLRKNVSLFYHVNVPGSGPDKIKKATLSGCTVHDAEFMTTAEIAQFMRHKVEQVRQHKDPELSKNMAIFKWLPWWACGYYLDFVSWLIYGLNIDLAWAGIPKDPFGSVMITSTGSLGIEVAWAPLCPSTRVPLLLTVGAIHHKAVVIDGHITARPIMPIGVTFDHRLIDGVHASQMAMDFKKCFAEPARYLLCEQPHFED